MLGVTFSPIEDLRRWRDEIGLESDLLCDAGRSVAMAYGAASSPTQEKAARLSVLIGPDGRIVRIYQPTDVGAHADAVLADLDA